MIGPPQEATPEMKNTKATLTIALALLASNVFAQLRAKPDTPAHERAVQVSATIYGAFDYNFEGVGAWVGYALIRFGDKPAKVATFADRNTSFQQRTNGAISGTETISLRFSDGSGTLDIVARFEGTPGATPGLYNLHEVGAIGNGTGDYSHASGYVTVQGPFLFPDPSITAGAPPWIGEIHGSIVGMRE
jgi:hypothetical protein